MHYYVSRELECLSSHHLDIMIRKIVIFTSFFIFFSVAGMKIAVYFTSIGCRSHSVCCYVIIWSILMPLNYCIPNSITLSIFKWNLVQWRYYQFYFYIYFNHQCCVNIYINICLVLIASRHF